jgi:cobaltochelatase CobS
MSGYKSRPFCDIYEGGGVFSFEEIDAADPNMTIVVNNALAGDHFFNPASGRAIYRSPDFVAIATANTYGMGANREYTGRERLDAAFLDRFRMGRVFVNVDLDLGESIARAIIDKPAPAPVDPRAQEIADLEARLTALRG